MSLGPFFFFLNIIYLFYFFCLIYGTVLVTGYRQFSLYKYSVLAFFQTATIDDASASQMKTLLLIITIVSNFPVIIVGMGAILLLIFIFLVCRNRQRKVRCLFIFYFYFFPLVLYKCLFTNLPKTCLAVIFKL